MYRGVRCRERIALKPTATNLKRAEQHKAAVEHAIANGTFDYAVTFPGSPRATKFAPEASQETVAGFLTKWLAGKKQHVSSSTFEGYRKLVELRLVPALGPTLLVDLKRKTVRDWLSTLEVSNKTLSNIQSCLRSALNDAVDNDELIDTNPLAGWTFSRKDQVKEDDVDPFSPEEQRAILAQLDGQAKNLVQFAFWTDMRTSEMVGLNWEDGGLRFQVQQSVDNVEPIGCQQLQMIRQHFNREFPAQCLTRSGVEQVGNLVQPLLANQRQIGALG